MVRATWDVYVEWRADSGTEEVAISSEEMLEMLESQDDTSSSAEAESNSSAGMSVVANDDGCNAFGD